MANDERSLSPLFTWRSAVVESRLSSTCRLVALTLSLHMNERGGSCFPSIPTLASETGLTTRGVRLNVAKLEHDGWLVVSRGGGRGRSNTYTAHVPERVNDVPPSKPERVNSKQGMTNPESRNGESRARKGERRRAKGGTTFTRGRHEDAIEDVPTASPTRKTAESVVNAHWERANPKPAAKWIALVQIVEHLVAAGWTEIQLARALDQTRTYTTNAIEYTLRESLKTNGTGPRAAITYDRADESGRLDLT